MKCLGISCTLAAALLLPGVTVRADNCNGCQPHLFIEDSCSITVNGCTLSAWSEVSGFTENCGDVGTACSDAKCEFTFKIKYVTTGTNCAGMTWTMYRVTPSGTSQTLTPVGTARTIESETVSKACGQWSDYDYQFTEDSTGTNCHVDGKKGCTACSPI